MLRPNLGVKLPLLATFDLGRIIADEMLTHDSAETPPHLVGKTAIVEILDADLIITTREGSQLSCSNRTVQATVNCCIAESLHVIDLVQVDTDPYHYGV
jgi:hypothetical protein